MNRVRCIAAVLAFALSANAQIDAPHWHGSESEWRRDTPCLRELKPKNGCVDMRDGRRVCRQSPSAEGADVITIVRAGRVLFRWKLGMAGDASRHFFRADLDGDGAPELILSTLEAVSNGYAIETVGVDIIDGRNADARPLHFVVEDFDPRISFLRAPASKRCRLFATEWLWTSDRKRGAGDYLVGGWLDYHAGLLHHTKSRPVLARRRLYSFDREMEQGTGNIYEWLRDPRAEALAAFVPEDDSYKSKPTIQSGVLQSIRDGKVIVAIGAEEHALELDWVRIVDDRTGRLFPSSYEPGSEVLAGQKIVIRSTGWPPEKYSEVRIRVH